MALLRLLLLHSIALPVVRGLQLRAPARHLRAARRPTAAAAPHHERTRLRARNDDAADPLEARLDVTVLWCHCLARELFREVSTNPPKAVPGFTVDDLSALWALVASASCLSVLWGAFGLATRQFAPAVLGAGVRQFSTGRPRTALRAGVARRGPRANGVHLRGRGAALARLRERRRRARGGRRRARRRRGRPPRDHVPRTALPVHVLARATGTI